MGFILIMCYYIIINIIAFVLFGIDKNAACKGKWRISEKTLLGFSVFGGVIGCYGGMRYFHHKTKHTYFKWIFLFSAIIHVLLLYLIYSGF